jgi:hypothetical protein
VKKSRKYHSQISVSNHYRTNERLFVIDANGFTLWQAEITRVRAGKYSVQYPEYPEDPEDDQEVQDTAWILADTRANCRIFRTQEV